VGGNSACRGMEEAHTSLAKQVLQILPANSVGELEIDSVNKERSVHVMR